MYITSRTRTILAIMASKRTASVRESQEFKESLSQETNLGNGSSQESIVHKRPRKEGSKDTIIKYAGPTNKVLPINIHFPPKHPGTTRLAAWNVSGLVACEKKVCFVLYCAFRIRAHFLLIIRVSRIM